ncbi:SulP family inorganic anion transporter [Gaetbulibacter sp. M240]|uniref:SulP family inorganic anion transporter n=1 Tax=Gaetbulibacter sp. M240 TaxID=3126511 RepID=UPI00374F1A6E
MNRRKKHTRQFFKTLPQNIFSGFVVSLIALPLGLGLAMASEAPPIAGIISAVMGGLIVSVLGGSHVTIAGLGNGLVGVLLVAVATLGLQNTYMAVVCSGVLVMCLGFLRMGTLSDFFPSSAIQGMLAAIGLIILGKQFHIMFGNKIQRDTALEYLLAIPSTLQKAINHETEGLVYAAVVGLISLAIMVFYAKIRNKYLQLVPAPMWIVLLSILFSYYFELVLKQPNPISPEYMLTGIPPVKNIISDIHTPKFDALGRLDFWSSVLALTLIASIESLLSIKAVDKLDPEKRRSNANKDLKALGLASVGSGLLGGLNVVAVIARSSVNVNNGATNRSSNFFHAVFLVLFIVLFSTQLKHISLPALMAILVYTGYKLASPKVVGKIFSIGKEQVIIFFVTLFTTLIIGLITGIFAGVLTTLIIHFFVNRSMGLFLRNVLKPNVLMYREPDNELTYYVSVKHFCSFLNYYRLKKQLDAVPENQDVIVDFSLCAFVDHTVMENMNDFQELFVKRGGHFEVVGLDLHDANSFHPFALRRLLPVPHIIKKSPTKRQKNIQNFANRYDLIYKSKKIKSFDFLMDFQFFKTKEINHIYNVISHRELPLKLFDIEFSEGEFIAKGMGRITMFYIELGRPIPEFTLNKEGFLERIAAFSGYHQDIDVEHHEDFSERFHLYGSNKKEVVALFNADLIHFFESNPYYHVESNGNALLLFSKERVAGMKELKALFDYGKRLNSVISKQ